MLNIFNKKHLVKLSQSIILFFAFFYLSNAQITGNNTVLTNSIEEYQFANGPASNAVLWSVNGGLVDSSFVIGTTHYVRIKWGANPGAGSVTFQSKFGVLGTLNVTIIYKYPTIPETPPNPIIVNESPDCTSITIAKSGNIPSGVMWYWQGTNFNGTSTALPATSSYVVTNSGFYYIRARSINGLWSTFSGSIKITIGGPISTWYADFDLDSYGDPNITMDGCTRPPGYTNNANDQCPDINGGGSTDGCPLVSSDNFSDKNYIYTIIPQIEINSISEINQSSDAIHNIVYFDGLGRPIQNIDIAQSPDHKDIVNYINYDNFGRQDKTFLPYPSIEYDGKHKTDALLQTNLYYATNYTSDADPIYGKIINPYSESEFEASPLNRVLKQGAPGYDWRITELTNPVDHSIKFDYQVNNSATEVRNYEVSISISGNTYTPSLVLNTSINSGHYPTKSLYKTVTKNENWQSNQLYLKDNTTEEFKNNLGQIILKRNYNNNVKHDTYYVYDDFGNLTYVLPPKAEPHTAKPDAVELRELCYQYKYDNRNRLVEKRIPGKGWEYIVYDILDRPVLTQDANQKAKSPDEWLFIKYDVFGRVVYTGIFQFNSSRTSLQTIFDNKSPAQNYETKLTIGGPLGVYYSNSDFPYTNIEVLTVNYYDNYTFNRAGAATSANAYGVISINKLKNLTTGTKTKVLGTGNWITTVNYYDAKSRPISVYNKNDYLQVTNILKSKLDFVGKVLESTTTHTQSGLPTITTLDYFTYDHVGRLKTHSQKINSQAIEVIASNHYDELGKLKTKEVGGKTTQARLQTVDYNYNIRGWLKTINNPASLGNDLFAFKINYNTAEHGATKLYNGNISETEWRTKNTDNSLKWYKYGYDALNRLKNATDNTNNYRLLNVNYDKNGNIIYLNRGGAINAQADEFHNNMDKLYYSYYSRSNKLRKVLDNGYDNFGFKDGANTTYEYSYDANGNMLKDLNKDLNTNITYNYLNLPTKVTKSGAEGGSIEYVYDALGIKQRKKVTNPLGITITDYAGNYIYENTGSGPQLKFFNHPEGYAEPNSGSSFNYVYQFKDHLGNIRLSYSDSNNNGSVNASEIIEENNYYPFGLRHKGYNNVVSSNANSVASKFKYNGKELEESLGLNLYEYGARMYDPSTARFTSIDPLTEDYISQSVYVYAANNPTFFQERNGESPDTIYINEEGEKIADIDDGSDAVYVVNKENEEALVEDLIEENVTNDNQDADTNAKIGEKHGRSLEDYQKEGMLPKTSTLGVAFHVGYDDGYDPENADNSAFLIQFQSGTGSAYGTGKGVGKKDKRNGVMSKVNPKIKDGDPKHDFGSMISSARSAKSRATQASKQANSTYTIQKGDNLTKIAKANNTTVGSLVKLNNIKTPNHIEAGATIKVKQ